MAVLPVLDVGSGPINLIAPNYAPVGGNSGIHPNGWTYGGGGNYIRPFQSFSQRIIDASHILGPFAMRLGGNITGRVVISTESESLGQLAYRDQPWYEFDDGNTGYVSKAEWWGSVVKTVIRLRDLNTEGHPFIHVEVAYFDAVDIAKKYNPSNMFSGLISAGGVLLGGIPPVFGWISGAPTPSYGGPNYGGGNGSGGPGNGGGAGHGGGMPGGSGGGDGGGGDGGGGPTPPEPNPDPKPLWETAGGALKNLVNNFSGALSTAYNNTIGEPIGDIAEFAGNILMGIEAGDLGVANHVGHNIQGPDENGSFNGIPGELKTNPRNMIMRDGLQQGYAKNLSDGSSLAGYTAGSNAAADGNALHNAIVNNGIENAVVNLGIGNNGAGAIAFYIHGRTTFNEGNFPGNASAAPNPTIDNNGNLIVYDTYEFANSNYDAVGNWVRDNVNTQIGNEINAVFDTLPGAVVPYTYDVLNNAGYIRDVNSGGTGGLSNISSLQNTYTGVVVSPHNLQASNPSLYNALTNAGFYSHVDASNLP